MTDQKILFNQELLSLLTVVDDVTLDCIVEKIYELTRFIQWLDRTNDNDIIAKHFPNFSTLFTMVSHWESHHNKKFATQATEELSEDFIEDMNETFAQHVKELGLPHNLQHLSVSDTLALRNMITKYFKPK